MLTELWKANYWPCLSEQICANSVQPCTIPCFFFASERFGFKFFGWYSMINFAFPSPDYNSELIIPDLSCSINSHPQPAQWDQTFTQLAERTQKPYNVLCNAKGSRWGLLVLCPAQVQTQLAPFQHLLSQSEYITNHGITNCIWLVITLK